MTYSENLPILELHIFHDQLILGSVDNDRIYLSELLNNAVNVKNYIQQYVPGNPQAINLLFKCLEILNNDEHSQQLISNILSLIYVHCYNQLNQNAKNFIANYTGLNDFQLNILMQSANFTLYYSEGIKRQRLEFEQDQKENNFQHSNGQVSKKHELDANESSSLAKRQKLKPSSYSYKRDAPLEDNLQVEHASKRTRLFK